MYNLRATVYIQVYLPFYGMDTEGEIKLKLKQDWSKFPVVTGMCINVIPGSQSVR